MKLNFATSADYQTTTQISHFSSKIIIFSKKKSSLRIGNTRTYWLTGRGAGQGLKIGTVPAKTECMAILFICMGNYLTC